ncbi:MAG TPA: hypothetical protein VFX44_08545 [Solirubrobacterales bacterium]|nr:hypothetical protein [Solirubrobacterales bacterium]
MSRGFDVSHLGGYSRAVFRHMQRRGPQSVQDLHDHFVFGRHGWHPETLDSAISELVATGYMCPADQQGVHRLTLRSPL